MQEDYDHYFSFTRCHLCVRIFSTKANLSSHIRYNAKLASNKSWFRPKDFEIVSLSIFSVIISSGTFIWERLSTAVLRAFLAPTARKCSLARATWQNMLEPYMKGRRGSTKRCHLILQINNRFQTTPYRWTVNIAARLLDASGVWTFTYPRRTPT